jgi:SpoVK/Ycf46/Vps4 family AAA+-type ATPase
LDRSTDLLSAYPWLGKSVKDYAKEYLNSTASVLILLGPPGTGKTSFLKSLIKEAKGEALVTYENSLLNEDGIFAHFISENDLELLIFEDADTYLGSRRDSGNAMMHRFLNISNGLVSPLTGKKIIFTTNLPSSAEIDPALMRPGRCFDVMHFRALTGPEATQVAKEVYGDGDSMPVLEDRKYTLAEVTNLDRVNSLKAKQKVGFLS